MANTKGDADITQRRLDARVLRYAGIIAGGLALTFTLSGNVEQGQAIKAYELASGLLVCSSKLDKGSCKDKEQNKK